MWFGFLVYRCVGFGFLRELPAGCEISFVGFRFWGLRNKAGDPAIEKKKPKLKSEMTQAGKSRKQESFKHSVQTVRSCLCVVFSGVSSRSAPGLWWSPRGAGCLSGS